MKQDQFIVRRKFLKIVGLASMLGPNLSFASKKFQDPIFKPVNVSPDRVIRTIVGLRPYRPSGFVLKSEQLNDKTIIHNYGHGGAGISLSWGTSKLAVDMAIQSGETSFAVLGCGVIGLSTARLLQQKGFDVTIYTKDLPSNTTSYVSGALWGSGNFSVYNESQVGNEFLSQFDQAISSSYRVFQELIGSNYGVSWIKHYNLGSSFNFSGSKIFYPGFKEVQTSTTDYPMIQQFNVMLIEPAIYLNALMKNFYIQRGSIKVKQFNSKQDLISLDEKIIKNCTGIGSRQLFNDTELTPMKGQMSILLPQPEIDYSYVSPSSSNLLYMIPRKDGVLLGGNSIAGDWSLEADNMESERILGGHMKIAKLLGS
jgi:hypothetical protein